MVQWREWKWISTLPVYNLEVIVIVFFLNETLCIMLLTNTSVNAGTILT